MPNDLLVFPAAADVIDVRGERPEIGSHLRALAVPAKIKGQDGEAFVLELFGELFPCLAVSAIAMEHQDGGRFGFRGRIKRAAQLHPINGVEFDVFRRIRFLVFSFVLGLVLPQNSMRQSEDCQTRQDSHESPFATRDVHDHFFLRRNRATCPCLILRLRIRAVKLAKV